jgi:hypothetical protein
MKWRMQAPVLTRTSLETLAIYVSLNQNVERVQIIQQGSGGSIGMITHARCYTGEQYADIDITDYKAW